MSKPWLMLLLLGYFLVNKTGDNKKKHWYVYLALTFFFIGDILIINDTNIIFLSLSLFFFSVGKIFFCIKFSHKKDFNVSRLIPFTSIMFLYTIFLIGFLYKSLEAFLVPALISFFLTLLMVQFSYLRQSVFSRKSYRYVFFGVLLFVLSEGMMAIKTFKLSLPLQDFLIMMFYGMGVYFMVFGIINEKEYELEDVEKYDGEINLS
ncbi:lysoplasmalogenase [Wocania ichthyoenteri]|uniref:lysoplasmalogenase n=1 Tax=Wocania ichthyoenteri TaxID=1230531 RepID=UPI0021CF8825|nr:lysoplasmalogenase [Wocania ichthyoenteri]